MKKQIGKTRIYLGDCLDVMKTFPDNSISNIITDPPYGLNFMGAMWDKGVPGRIFWKEFFANDITEEQWEQEQEGHFND